MKTILFSAVMGAVALVAGPATLVQAQHRHGVVRYELDDVKRLGDLASDQARELYREIIREVDRPRERASMMAEARDLMVCSQRIEAYARTGDVHKLHHEVVHAEESLAKLKQMVFEYGREQSVHIERHRDHYHLHHHRGDTRHVRHLIGDLRDTVAHIDEVVHHIEDAHMVREDYPRSRPGFDVTPDGIRIGGRGLNIRIPVR